MNVVKRVMQQSEFYDVHKVWKYSEEHTSDGPDYLQKVERETWLNTLSPQMISGKLQGRILSLISRLKRPSRILEIGTFTGYSALCMAEGLQEEGELITIELHPELAEIARNNFEKSPFAGRIKVLEGQALEILKNLDATFDIIFLDADKKRYPEYANILVDLLSPKGLLIADNVLWYGKVATNLSDDDTTKLKFFNDSIQKNEALVNVLLPVRDGLMIVEKK
jgi:predicted O-methyltransferase YrrM